MHNRIEGHLDVAGATKLGTMSTTERDSLPALSSGDAHAIYNSTTGAIEVTFDGGGSWSPLAVAPTLHWMSMAATGAITTQPTNVGSGYYTLHLGDSQWNLVNDPFGMVNTISHFIEIQQDGVYQIHVATRSANPIVETYIDGVKVASGSSLQASWVANDIIVPLVTGQRIDFRGYSGVTSSGVNSADLFVNQIR